MASRITSRTLVGRSVELRMLTAAADAARDGTSRIVLVSGDAGIGKSRLVGEAVEHAREQGLLAAVGGCVQLGSISIAFAPLAEALRQLHEHITDPDLAARADDLQSLLAGGGVDARGGSLLERLLALLSDLARERPVLLVLEDLHWADASTRDLISFLGRNLRGTPIALVLTYRDDEVHRRHPLRPVLATLERDADIERVQLSGLDRDHLDDLLADICELPLAARDVDALFARSAGNPFYVEELVASGNVGDGVPGTLTDVIMGRMSALSEDAQTILHAAAVVDDNVDDELVAEVAGVPVSAVTAALREAVTHGIVVVDGSACRFRHALVREALHDDLLPGERARLHVGTARALEQDERIAPHKRWAMLAFHWDSARDVPRAFAASVRAAVEAERVSAYADAAEHYERALALRDQVPDPDALAGLGLVDLLLRAAEAVQASSRTHRGIVLAEAALRELGEESEPERRALVLELIGRISWTLHRGESAVSAYERAAQLVEGRPASREQAFVLSALGQSLMRRELYVDAIAILRRAIEVAAAVGADDVQGHAQCSLGPTLVGLGQVDEGIAASRRAIELSRSAGVDEDVSRGYTNLMHNYLVAAQYAEAGAEVQEAIEYVVKSGHARHYGEAIVGNAIAALACAGRYAEAQALHSDPRIPKGDAYQELRWIPVLFATGRLDEARWLVAEMLSETTETTEVQFRSAAWQRAAQLAIMEQRWDDAQALIADADALAARTDDQTYRAFGFGLALFAAANQAIQAADRGDETVQKQARATADELLAAAEAFADEQTQRGVALLPEPRAWLATLPAEHALAHGRDDGAMWGEVASTWDSVGQPYVANRARLRQADALLRDGARAEASVVLRAAVDVADAIGAIPLAEDLRELARRGRLELRTADAGGDGNGPGLDVTPRELEVLRLLAQGQTNRQIGKVLFISEKTASVHVSNLLRKLEVANRGEAAAVARRIGVS